MNGGAADTFWQPGAKRGLAGRCLALARLQHVAHDNFADRFVINAGALQRSLNGH